MNLVSDKLTVSSSTPRRCVGTCPRARTTVWDLRGHQADGARSGKRKPRLPARTRAAVETAEQLQCAGSIPTTKGGAFADDRKSFVEQFRIRGYEVGPDRHTTLPTLANLLQENAGNHAICMWGKTDEGFAADPTMVEKGLILAMTRLQIQVDRYPAWGDVIDVETWFTTETRASARRDWVIRDAQTGETISRATSTWVMIDVKKRKMTRIPEEMKQNLKHFVAPQDRHAVAQEEARLKLPDMSETIIPGPIRVARQSNVDMNGHINNVAYIVWAMDTVPDELHNTKSLAEIEIDFKAECNAGDQVDSSSCRLETENGSATGNMFLHSLKKINGDKMTELIRLRTKWI